MPQPCCPFRARHIRRAPSVQASARSTQRRPGGCSKSRLNIGATIYARCSMNFAPRNLFVTGGAGFIGTNFVRHWLANTQEGRLIVFDALTYAGNIENLAGLERNPRYEFVRGDICDESTVRTLLEKHRIDT